MCDINVHCEPSVPVLVSQVVSRPPVRGECRKAPGGTRWTGHVPGQRVAVQTWRLCPVRLDEWEEQKWNQEGFPHQDNVSGMCTRRAFIYLFYFFAFVLWCCFSAVTQLCHILVHFNAVRSLCKCANFNTGSVVSNAALSFCTYLKWQQFFNHHFFFFFAYVFYYFFNGEISHAKKKAPNTTLLMPEQKVLP